MKDRERMESPRRPGVLAARALCALLAGLVVAGAVGCGGDDSVIPFVVYTPEGQDTFAGVSEVRVAFGDKESRTSLSSSGDSFDIKLELDAGQTGVVTLEGLGPTGQVLCRGQSPEILSVATSEELTLYVARVGTFGKSPAVSPAPARGVAAGNYRTEDWDGVENDVTATLFFGGVSEEGTPLASVYYYDSYFHTTYDLEPLPAPRSELTALNIDSGYFLLFGGRDEGGEPTGRLDMLLPGDYGFTYTEALDYGVAAADAARASAPSVRIGPYPSLLAGENVRIQNSFLVVGGQGPEGPRCDALHLVARYDLVSYLWSVTGEAIPLSGCRAGHTATVVRTSDSQDASRIVLVYGGGEPGDPVAEAMYLAPEQVDVSTVDWHVAVTPLPEAPGPMRFEHGAAALSDGRILVVGGRTRDGTPLASGVLYDPAHRTFTELPDLLSTPRFGVTVFRSGDELVVAGGQGADGVPLDEADVINVAEDPPTRLSTTHLAVSRSHAVAFPLPTGTWALFGGEGTGGTPVAAFEIYTPGAASGQAP